MTNARKPEKPIIFTGESIPAIMRTQNPKTQTRRTRGLDKLPDCVTRVGYSPFTGMWHAFDDRQQEVIEKLACPYGTDSDRLWVREEALPDFPKEFSYYDWSWREVPDEYRKSEFVLYRASYPSPGKIKWHPSIFMPRWASRINLEITGIKVERIQDISEQDILAEGVTVDRVAQWCNVHWSDMPTLHHAWRVLWESINGLGSWERNPWVWVIEFKRLEVQE